MSKKNAVPTANDILNALAPNEDNGFSLTALEAGKRLTNSENRAKKRKFVAENHISFWQRRDKGFKVLATVQRMPQNEVDNVASEKYGDVATSLWRVIIQVERGLESRTFELGKLVAFMRDGAKKWSYTVNRDGVTMVNQSPDMQKLDILIENFERAVNIAKEHGTFTRDKMTIPSQFMPSLDNTRLDEIMLPSVDSDISDLI